MMQLVRKPWRAFSLLLAVLGLALLASPAYSAAAELDIVISAADDELGAYTGTAPFDAAAGPGNDTAALDDVVRTNDYISFSWAIAVEGAPPPSTDTTITQTLPDGVVWEALPGFCRTDGNPVSAITNGGRTIVCNLGNKGNVAEAYNVRAFVKGSVPNGTVINTSATISSSDENTDEVTSNSVAINVTAAPRLNLAKDEAPPTVTSGFRGGVWGHYITFPITLQVESENGKGTKGFEQIVATQANPLTFKDVLGPGHEDLVLDGCGLGGFSSLPGGSGGTATSVTHSGSIGCTLNAGEVDIRIPSATGTVPDLTGSHAPTHNSNGTVVAANTSFLGVYYIRFWIANADVPVDGLNVSDVFEDFDPVSISGTANYGGAGEPTADNDAEAAVSRKDPVQGNLEIFKFFSPVNNSSTSAWGNNQHIYPGTVFRSHLGTRLQGDLPINPNNVVLCEIIDTTTYHLTTEGLAAGQQPGFLTAGVAGITVTIEFGTGGAQGHDADAWADMRQENCDDADPMDPDDDTQWATNWEDLGVPIDQITKVRMKLNSASGELPPHAGWNNRLTLQLKARNTDPVTGDLLTQGTILANFANFATDFTAGSGTWKTNNYNPQTTGGSWGDRVILARGEVRIAKDSVPSGVTSIVGGDTLQFKLQPTVTGYDLPDGVMHNVVVTDTISQYSDYVVGSGSPEPTSVVPNGNGTTTLTWNLGDLDINEVVEPITYQVKYKLAIPNGAQSVNTAIISSPDDISQQSFRTDTHTVTTSRVSGILVSKQTLTPWTEPEDDHVFQIEYANNAGTAQSWMTTIDILPYNGDPLGSNFNGELRLKEVQVSNGEDVYYTVRDPEEISIYPKDASNDLVTGDTKWCLESDFGTSDCPASLEDVTAVMVRKSTPTDVGEGFSYRIVLETENNHSGDVYANKAGVGAGNSPLQTSSETVEDHVVASSLGNYVWYDTNRDGLQDQDEDPVEGATVRLNGTDKHGHIVELETVTNGDGLYLFEHLVSGDYEITFVAPDGYEFTLAKQGNDPELDSDADPVTGATGPITINSPIPLQADQEDLTWDAGIVQKRGKITIVKDARPDSGQAFGFTIDGGLTPGAFNLVDDGQGQGDRQTFEEVPAGEYTVRENPVAGWALSFISCSDDAGEVDLASGSVKIDLAPGQEVNCLFVNEKQPAPSEPERPVKPDKTKKKPRIVLAKSANKSAVLPGGRVAYRIEIRNTRRGTVAKNVRVCDRLPAKMSLVKAPGASLSNGQVCWRFKRIAFRPKSKPIVRHLVARVDRNARPGQRLLNVVVAPGGIKATAPVRVKPGGSGAAPVRGGGVTG